MKVLQVFEEGAFRILDMETPKPGPGQVLLRVEAVATCPQWDLHLRHNEPMFVGHRFEYPYPPGQPGHEATGTIAAVGAGVTGFEVGQRASAWRDPGHDRPGCYAQFVLLDVENAIVVPEELPVEQTASIELAMCVASSILQLKRFGALGGKRVAIAGLGPAGLIAGQMARAEGAASVTGFDFHPARRGLARDLGFDAAFDPSDPETLARFPVRSSGPAIDTGIDCVGAKRSVEWLMDRAWSFVALFGVQREEYAFTPRHYSGLTLCGYPGHTREAAEAALGLIWTGRLRLDRLLTAHLPLERYGEGIDLLERQEAIKICFRPWWSDDNAREYRRPKE